MDSSERLKEVIRLVSHGNQADFARRCKMPPATISRLATGKYRMTGFYAEKIRSGVEGLNADYLLGKSDYIGEIGEDGGVTVEDYKKRICELEEEVRMLKWLVNKAMIKEQE